MHKKCVLMFLLILTFVGFAQAAHALESETGYKVKCEPVEVSDVTRVIRNIIWDAIEADPAIDHKYMDSDITVIDKHPTQLTLSELNQGQGLTFDTSNLTISLGGIAEGHQCYATAEVRLFVSVVRLSDGAILSNEITTHIEIPGAWATKKRVTITNQ